MIHLIKRNNSNKIQAIKNDVIDRIEQQENGSSSVFNITYKDGRVKATFEVDSFVHSDILNIDKG